MTTDVNQAMAYPKLSHVHLKVNDIKSVKPFYEELFGMTVSDDLGTFVFLTNETTHHTLALQQTSTQFSSASQKLYHIAFEVNSEDELYGFARRLRSSHIEFTAVDHGISWAIYFNDPEGTGLELFLDRRKSLDGVLHWSGRSHRLMIPE